MCSILLETPVFTNGFDFLFFNLHLGYVSYPSFKVGCGHMTKFDLIGCDGSYI